MTVTRRLMTPSRVLFGYTAGVIGAFGLCLLASRKGASEPGTDPQPGTVTPERGSTSDTSDTLSRALHPCHCSLIRKDRTAFGRFIEREGICIFDFSSFCTTSPASLVTLVLDRRTDPALDHADETVLAELASEFLHRPISIKDIFGGEQSNVERIGPAWSYADPSWSHRR